MSSFEQQPNIQEKEEKARKERIKELVEKTKKIGGLDRDKPKTVPEGGMEFNEYDEIVFTLQEIIDGKREYINYEGKPESLGMTAKEVLENEKFINALTRKTADGVREEISNKGIGAQYFALTISALLHLDRQYNTDLIKKIESKLNMSINEILEYERFIYDLTETMVAYAQRGIGGDGDAAQWFIRTIPALFHLDQQYNIGLVESLEKELNMSINEVLEDEGFVSALTKGMADRAREGVDGRGDTAQWFIRTIPALFHLDRQYNTGLIEKTESNLETELDMSINEILENGRFISVLTRQTANDARGGIGGNGNSARHFTWTIHPLRLLIPHFQELSKQERQRKLEEKYGNEKDLPPIPERRML